MGYPGRVQAATVTPMLRLHSRSGYTLVEVLIFLVMGAVVAGGLYEVLLAQQRHYRNERHAVQRHDALRSAGAVLATGLLETGGDFTALWADSIGLRSPVGFGIVCAVDNLNDRLGLFNVHGSLSAAAGDSLLIHSSSGWIVTTALAPDVSVVATLDCPYAAGPDIERVIHVDGSVSDVGVGSPVRAFHSYTYRLVKQSREWWLARVDGNSPQLLAGPFEAAGAGLEFRYLNAAGRTTSIPDSLERVEMLLVAASEDAGVDTLKTAIKPRNR